MAKLTISKTTERPPEAPESEDSNHKGQHVMIRLSRSQKAAIEAAAKREGDNTSNWIRRCVLRATGWTPELDEEG